MSEGGFLLVTREAKNLEGHAGAHYWRGRAPLLSHANGPSVLYKYMV